MLIVVLATAVVAGLGLGWFVIGPLVSGCRPFDTPGGCVRRRYGR